MAVESDIFLPFANLLSYRIVLLGIPILLFVLLEFLTRTYRSPELRRIPGPFLAKFTNLWLFVAHWRRVHVNRLVELHRKHGVAVRVGPNTVSLSDPSLIKTVYSIRGEYQKTDLYSVGDAINNGLRIENVFSTRSKTFHSTYIRPYQKYFSSNAINQKEALSDQMAVSLCQHLEPRFVEGPNAGKTADIAEWIELAAWDLSFNLIFGEDVGFLKTGDDVNGMMHMVQTALRYFGIVGQMPWLDMWLGKNPYCPVKLATFDSVLAYAVRRTAERVAQRASAPDEKPSCDADFLDNFLEAKELFPETIGDDEVVSYLMLSLLGGGDTTAIETQAIVHHVLKNERVQKKLQAELDAANFASTPPPYAQTRGLPYLDAVIREGIRLHPAVVNVLERHVPQGGLQLPGSDVVLPAGTRVGLNPWVVGRDKGAFGDDADVFRPERWLRCEGEGEADYEARLQRMRDAIFVFGSGSRICMGRHLAMLEMHKLVSTLFSRYDITLAPEHGGYRVRHEWLSYIDDVKVKIQLRPGVKPIEAVKAA